MELNELRKVAEAVAKHEPDFKDIHEYLEALRNMQAELSGTTVLALLSRLEQAEQDRVKLRNRLDAMRRQRDGYRNQLRKTEQQVARVRAFLEYRKENSAVARDGLRALDGDTRG